MARRGGEEGEASDGDSLEEITAEDFKHDGRGSSRSRVWTAAELLPFQRNYGNALANFAWAQAVQNKPLLYAAPAEPEKSDAVDDDEEEEDEKEEGELEEGEIELGETINETIDDKIKETEASETAENPLEEDESQIGEFDKRVSLILEDLETVTEDEAKISLESVHARLRKSFESLKQMHSESHLPVLDALVQQAVMGLQTVHAVVVSSNLKKNEDLFLRLLMHIKNQYSILLTSEQLKELEEMAQSLVYSNNKGGNVNAIPSQGLASSGKIDSTLGISGVAGLTNLRIPTLPKKAVEFSPLLDLHADHDEGSLPSPTRENVPPTLQIPISFGMGLAVPAQPMPPSVPAQQMPLKTVEDVTFKPYDTDAFKAVSSYQQKYNVNSFSESNRFPSPTPSEDNDMDDDIQGGEVSSAPVVYNARDVNSASSSQLLGSSYSGAFPASSSAPQNATTRAASQLVSGPSVAVKIPAKSRDPRIRISTPEVGGTSQNRPLIPNELSVSAPNTRKHRAFDETLPDGNNMKRQRNELTDSRDPQLTSGRGGWLEESSGLAPPFGHRNVEVELRKQGNVESFSNRQNPMSNFHGTNGGIGSMASAPVSTSIASTVSMPSLVKGMALNPTMLLQLIQSEHQRIAAESQLKKVDSAPSLTAISNANRYTGTVSAENGATSIASERERALAEKSKLPAQSASLNIQNDVGRIRMKPRDPRRILHTSNNVALRSESGKPEPAKFTGNLSSDALSSKDQFKVRELGEQAQTSGLPSHPAPQPDFARLFTTGLSALANLVSSNSPAPAANILPSVSQATPQAVPVKINKADVMTAAAADLNGQKTVSGLPNASQEPNPWGDVDHLLDGYDDQQRADIQRERSRRIDEQNTMFAARKLCLVLDLDHTLLNSAKFVEVDPVHEEILRKKEEIDREKPYRHLFRFPHMGMWTKLRPGVWNFLERASQLFELHLYTMGNKLYATQMAKVLDPTGSLFSGRVISRGDENDTLDGDERVPKSKDLDGVLGLESAVVIIDDSVRVWPHNRLNLIVVERYTYFPCSRRQFGLPGPSLLEIDHDERPEAGTLASSLAVIERIHNIFYSHRALHDVDVRNILAAEQRKILAGCKIVFSRIFPVGEANPQSHPLWQTAEQFGAVCTNQIDEHVTHVVANSLGTDKVNWALSTGRFVVQPGWVEASALLYRRANELDFAVKI